MSSKRPRRSAGNAPAKRPRHIEALPPPSSTPRNDIRDEIRSLAASRWRSESDKVSKAASGTDLSILVYRKYLSVSNAHGALSALDDQEYFQLYLWPELCRLVEGFRLHSDTPDWVSLQPYVLSIASFFNYRQDHHPARAADFLVLFDQNAQAVSTLIEAFFRLEIASLTFRERRLRIAFLCHAFRALEHESVKLALLPLLSLPVWVHLSERSCAEQLQRFPYLRKPLSKLRRRSRQRDVSKEAPLPEVAIFALVRELEMEIVRCSSEPSEDSIAIISEVIYLLSELLSQLRLRRTLLPLLSDRDTLPLVQGLSLEVGRDMAMVSTACFADWLRVLDLFVFYVTFPLDPGTGASLSRDAVRADRARRLLALQRVSHAICERESLTSEHPLRKLPMASHSIVGSAESLRSVFVDCEDHILKEIQTSLGLTGLVSALFESGDDKSMEDNIGLPIRSLVINAISSYCSVQKDALESFKTAPIMMTEQDLWGPLGSNESRSTAALPVLNLDFLNLNDYLLRNFALYKWESSWAIREDIEDAIVRMRPSFAAKSAKFAGWAKMAAPLKSVTVTDLGHQQVDSPALSHVNVQVEVDVSRLSGHIQREWGSLQQHDIVFLVKLQPPTGQAADQAPSSGQSDDQKVLFSNCCVRGLVVGKPDEETGDNVDGKQRTFTGGHIVRLSGSVDSLQCYYDSKGKVSNLEEVFSGFNIAIRRRSEVNNFFPVLSSLRELVISESQVLPKWLEPIFLGRSTLSSSDSEDGNTSTESSECLDFADTFVSKQHIAASFPSLKVHFITADQTHEGEVHTEKVGYRITLKRSEDECRGLDVEPYALQVKGHTASVFKVSNSAIFNEISFNMKQIDAIRSGMRPGLTLIAGPPGTGKTSCIVQVASNLYKSHPHERILIITRTNHALNDLVERILLRGVDPVRVLRLGQGESEISADEPLSKAGRVAVLLQQRLRLLSEVALLAKSLDPTASNNSNWSCESASIFYKEVVKPELAKFTGAEDKSLDAFPFKKFIDELTLEPESGGNQEGTAKSKAAMGDPLEAYTRVSDIFKELEALHFLEVLRTSRQRGSYLVTSHASIVAMTCVHAAMQRKDLVSQSFTYDSLIMEEAAECLEVEAFLSLVLQRTTRLKRIVLVGDHKQLPPVVQDTVLQQRSNLGQSLFARLVRLGNRVVHLDRQGRSRRSIADLFRWRYPQLVDMDFIRQDTSFAQANPGFLYTAQVIDTGELTSESQPLPHYYQNVAEAEYIAFTFIYMRMLGYPADRIAVLTTYNGQVQLLKEVISGRSAQFGNLGSPLVISTVDKFQGRQADYVLLSVVRTKNLGHFRDVRRITVAMSRARFGLYIFGYLSLLSSSAEFKPVLSQLKGRHNLTLVADETFSTRNRQESDSSESGISPPREVHSPADMATIVSHLHRGNAEHMNKSL